MERDGAWGSVPREEKPWGPAGLGFKVLLHK